MSTSMRIRVYQARDKICSNSIRILYWWLLSSVKKFLKILFAEIRQWLNKSSRMFILIQTHVPGNSHPHLCHLPSTDDSDGFQKSSSVALADFYCTTCGVTCHCSLCGAFMKLVVILLVNVVKNSLVSVYRTLWLGCVWKSILDVNVSYVVSRFFW